MKTKILYLFLFVLSFFSCEEPNLIWVEREIADCCNPWDQIVGTDSESAARLFLEMRDVDVVETEIRDEGRRVRCIHCCECPTGQFVRLQIAEQQLERAEILGFFEE